MFVWEKAGRVWIMENGVKNPTPLIDISEEVGDWRDFGLLGFALDPGFLSNGHIYLLYVVDRHHLLNFGTDGSLLASCGDGASYSAVDPGGDVGAFRAQMVYSLSGKFIRIDPAPGAR
jgi:glucose/arabinose dehydrogenase